MRCVTGVVLALLLTAATNVNALDAYQDRKGVFGGFGLGGGLAFDGGEPGGGGVLDLQLGGGATKNITLAMDVDFWLQADENDTRFLITPGPELTYFFGDTGLFLRPGIAAALVMVWPEDEDFDFRAGVDIALGFGWEFFIGANIALGLTLEGEYIVMPSADDLASVGVLFTLKRY